MDYEEKVYKEEKDRLKKVLEEIKVQIEKYTESAKDFKNDAINEQKDMWRSLREQVLDLSSVEGAATLWQHQSQIEIIARLYGIHANNVIKLTRMLISAYFGRIDFIEDGDKKYDNIYIGIHNLMKDGDILVYDWRAPVCSMFYDYETGKSSYESPIGKINGNINLKRQYRIEKNEIISMVDCSVSIFDNILVDILGESKDIRMKTIVASIQKEQNAVIRDNTHEVLLVRGAAGSGKTSIALHRAAYILYKHRETLKAENIIIFSPSNVFNEYISNVLPELGEDNILRTTYKDFFEGILGENLTIEGPHEQMEYILYNKDNIFALKRLSISFKNSLSFYNILKSYTSYINSGEHIKISDIVYNDKTVMSKIQMKKFLTQEYIYLPLVKRLEKMKNRINFLLEPYIEERITQVKEIILENENILSKNELNEKAVRIVNNELSSLRKKINSLTYTNIEELYIDLFKSNKLKKRFMTNIDENIEFNLERICKFTIDQFKDNIVMYEDLQGILYMMLVVYGQSEKNDIKHVIIDEAQDYTLLQHELFNIKFSNCSITMLGDPEQSLNPDMNGDSYKRILNAYSSNNSALINLNKSYLSTVEIFEFCNELAKEQNEVEYIERHGTKPLLIKTKYNERSGIISDEIGMLLEKGAKTIAVAGRTKDESTIIFNDIKKMRDCSFLSGDNTEYIEGAVVVPVYLLKGLEFDAVIIFNLDEYGDSEVDRRLLYNVFTRAMHNLDIYYTEKINKHIKQIPKDLYECVNC